MIETERPLTPGVIVTVHTTLERVTDYMVDDVGDLMFSTSSTPGVEIMYVLVDGDRVSPDESFHETLLDCLYDEGYTS